MKLYACAQELFPIALLQSCIPIISTLITQIVNLYLQTGSVLSPPSQEAQPGPRGSCQLKVFIHHTVLKQLCSGV